MPSPDAILQGLTAIANQFRWLAVVWHVLLAALLLAIATHRSSRPLVAVLAAAPFLSVSVLAWRVGNAFNGTVMAATALALSAIGSRLRPGPLVFSSVGFRIAGALMIVFGAAYPHFLSASGWHEYVYSSPFGLVPCPTLSVVIGLTLLLGFFESTAWTTVLALAGLFYGMFGALRLGVTLDTGLIAGATALAFAGSRSRIAVGAMRTPRAAPNHITNALSAEPLNMRPLAQERKRA